MRVMVIVKATKDSEQGLMPSTEMLEAMGKFNEALANAGIMLSGDGLKPTSQGKRVAFDGARRSVKDGPFAPSGEQLAGFWIWQVASIDEAVDWVKRCPNPLNEASDIEIRPRAMSPPLYPHPGSDAESFVMALAERNAAEAVSYATEAGIFQAAGGPAPSAPSGHPPRKRGGKEGARSGRY